MFVIRERLYAQPEFKTVASTLPGLLDISMTAVSAPYYKFIYHCIINLLHTHTHTHVRTHTQTFLSFQDADILHTSHI